MTPHKMLSSIMAFVLLTSASALTCPDSLELRSKYRCEHPASIWGAVGELFVPHPESELDTMCCCDDKRKTCAPDSTMPTA